MDSEVLINIGYFVIGVIVLIRAGIYVVRSLTSIGRFLGTSEYTVSFILMALATSLPELGIGVNAGFSEAETLSLGNIIGTNIVNLTLVLGVVAVIVGRITLTDYEKFSATKIFHLLLVAAPVILLIDGTLGRLEGVLLILLFLWNLSRLLNLRERIRNRELFITFRDGSFREALESIGGFFKNIWIFIVSLAFLLGASYLIVESGKFLSLEFGLPEILIGVFVIGLGTSLPELAFGVRSASIGQGDMSIGNIFGSSVINATLVLGATSIISPIHINGEAAFWLGSFFMLGSMALAYYFLRTKDFLVRKEGLILIFVYIIFILSQIGGINVFGAV